VSDTSFEQEIQEEYRRAQAEKLWQQYRVPLIAGITVLLLAVAGYQGWSYWHAGKVDESSREFERVAELVASGPGKEKEAADRFAKLAATASSGYAMAARFQEAGLRAEMRQFPAALKIYDEISASTSDPLFRDYAQIRAATLMLEAESLANTTKRLGSIAAGSGPWAVIAKELLAYASWRAGKKDEALKLYAEVIAAKNAPSGSARRAKEMTTLINAGLKLSDLNTKPGISTPGVTPMLLQPAQPGQGPNPLLPDAAPPEEPGLLGPAMPEQPTPPTPTP
jgi:hypothetical protein